MDAFRGVLVRPPCANGRLWSLQNGRARGAVGRVLVCLGALPCAGVRVGRIPSGTGAGCSWTQFGVSWRTPMCRWCALRIPHGRARVRFDARYWCLGVFPNSPVPVIRNQHLAFGNWQLACTHVCTCVLEHMHTCLLACLRACVLARLHTCVRAHVRPCARACVSACVRAELRSWELACARTCACV